MIPDPLVEQQLDTILIITDSKGKQRRLLQKRETVLVNPATGERHFQNEDAAYLAPEGRTVDVQHYVVCTACDDQPLASPVCCADCRKSFCKSCTIQGRCRWCWCKYQLGRFLRWLIP